MGCGLGALAVHAEAVETTGSSIVEQVKVPGVCDSSITRF